MYLFLDLAEGIRCTRLDGHNKLTVHTRSDCTVTLLLDHDPAVRYWLQMDALTKTIFILYIYSHLDLLSMKDGSKAAS